MNEKLASCEGVFNMDNIEEYVEQDLMKLEAINTTPDELFLQVLVAHGPMFFVDGGESTTDQELAISRMFVSKGITRYGLLGEYVRWCIKLRDGKHE